MSVRPQAAKPAAAPDYRSLPKGLFTRRQSSVNQISDADRPAAELAAQARQIRCGTA